MWLLGLRRWRWSRRRAPAAGLVEVWHSPLPGTRAPVGTVDFLVCDAEMSSPDPDEGELLSLAWVRISGGEILLGSSEQQLIRNRDSVGQSAAIHGLRDCDLTRGGGLDEALERLLAAARGCVLVFHNAALDLAFLNRAAKRALGAPLLLPVVDTLRLEQKLLLRRGQPIAEGALRLNACRERYGLPAHSAHDALADAIATAELLLAHVAGRGPGLRLRDLL